MEDFFYGYVRNYHSFHIQPDSNNTKWTNKILGFYDQLGTLLGAKIEYEWKRYDLCWFWKDEEDPWLHVEHENGGSWSALEDTIRKINESEAEDLIAVMYPDSQENWDKLVKEMGKVQKKWTEETEVLVILDASYFQTKVIKLEGHIFSNSGNMVLNAIKKTDEEGIYYAILQ